MIACLRISGVTAGEGGGRGGTVPPLTAPSRKIDATDREKRGVVVKKRKRRGKERKEGEKGKKGEKGREKGGKKERERKEGRKET